MHSHRPKAPHSLPGAQVPQSPPQPSGPHCLPVQLGVQSKQAWNSSTQSPRKMACPAQPCGGGFPQTSLTQEKMAIHCCFASGEVSTLQVSWQAASSPQLEKQFQMSRQLKSPIQMPVWHAVSGGQNPQLPPQPSVPHWSPVQFGTHEGSHNPLPLHWKPFGHWPQEPPQPSAPHCLVRQFGVQTLTQFRPMQAVPSVQVPQLPPQPSPPQVLGPMGVLQLGTQGGLQLPFGRQMYSSGQAPQVPPQPSEPQDFPAQLGTQLSSHWKSSQVNPLGQSPQEPSHPLGPHSFPPQSGVHSPQACHRVWHGPAMA